MAIIRCLISVKMKAGTADNAHIREEIGGPAELLVFVLAEGFAFKNQSKAIIVPQNVDPASLSKDLDNSPVISNAAVFKNTTTGESANEREKKNQRRAALIPLVPDTYFIRNTYSIILIS